MLLLTLAALVAQDVASPMPKAGDAPSAVTRRFQVRPDGSVASLDHNRCETLLRLVSPGSLPQPLGRAGEDRVRMYHLLDRRIDGCPAPIVVSHDLPEANAARGRNLAEGRVRGD